MLISFVIPCFNRERLLPRALDSIFEQGDKQIEVICIDDCSTDNTVGVIEDYRKRYDCITLLKNPENSGPAITRNNGFDICRGEFTVLFDSDNQLLPGSIAFMRSVLQQRGESHDLFYFGTRNPETGGTWSKSPAQEGVLQLADLLSERVKGEFTPVLSRRALASGIRFERTRAGGEGLLWMSMLKARPGYYVNTPVQNYYTDHADRDFSHVVKRASVYATIHDRFRMKFGTDMLSISPRCYARSAAKSGWYWMTAGDRQSARERFTDSLHHALSSTALIGLFLTFGPRKIAEWLMQQHAARREG